MKKMTKGAIFLALTFALAGCGGNRYVKTFSAFNAEYHPKTVRCAAVAAEEESVKRNEKTTIADLRREYEDDGYELVGMSTKNAVPLNAKHRKLVIAACRRAGADVALYDYGTKILYFGKKAEY